MIPQLDRQLLRGAAVRYGVERCRQEVRLGELQAPGAGGTVNYQSMGVVAPEAHHPVNRSVEERDRPWSVYDVNAHSVTHSLAKPGLYLFKGKRVAHVAGRVSGLPALCRVPQRRPAARRQQSAPEVLLRATRITRGEAHRPLAAGNRSSSSCGLG